ncbi:hypothetical protein VTN49DRAFT_3323 [Thermomyces lanuginosus]|uniref:uncharacterized protein n=1 Tax=Thermomyces lanuginosus TaxID=5541 RepID=UPI0037446C27
MCPGSNHRGSLERAQSSRVGLQADKIRHRAPGGRLRGPFALKERMLGDEALFRCCPSHAKYIQQRPVPLLVISSCILIACASSSFCRWRYCELALRKGH